MPFGERWHPEHYTDFDALYHSLRTTLSESDVVTALRRALHHQEEDLAGVEKARDPREDRQLGAALSELLRLAEIPVDADSIYDRWLNDNR